MFLHEQIRALSHVYDVVAVVNTDDTRFLARRGISVRVEPLRIERAISPIADAKCLIRLTKLLSRSHFTVVHSINPKSGLIAMLAAFAARIPVRIHTFTGQVWVTRKGAMRWLLKTLDRIIGLLATHVVADSMSQLQFLREEGILNARKGFVPGSGSVGGVDIVRFAFNARSRSEIRDVFSIPQDDVVFIFVGRMNRDKGIEDLARAYRNVASANANVHLLIVGPDEKGMKSVVMSLCGEFLSRVHMVDYTDVPEAYMSASDILCLPSYREGFGTVVIEAAAAGVPSIASRIYGLTDAIVDGKTGLFHEVGDVKALAEKMLWLSTHPAERQQMGSAGRERARREFSQETVTAVMLEFYKIALTSSKHPS